MRTLSILTSFLLLLTACSSKGDGDRRALSASCAEAPKTVPPQFEYEDTYHIDPSYTGGSSDGSMERPYTDLSFITINEGRALEPDSQYLFKAGTELNITQNYINIGYAALPDPQMNTKMGAYGEGERPILYSTQPLDPEWTSVAKMIGMGPNVENITIEGLNIDFRGSHPTTCINAQTTGYSRNIVIFDNELQGCGVGVRVWGTGDPFDDSDWFILENYIHNIGSDGIITARTHRVEVGHNVIERVNTAFLDYEGEEDFCPEDSCPGDGVQLINGDDNWVHHNTILRPDIGNKFGIILTGTSDQTPRPTGAIVECNTLVGPAPTGGGGVAMYLAGHDKMIVRYNTVLPPHTTGIMTINHQSEIYGNVLVGGFGGVTSLYANEDDFPNYQWHANIFNNVFYGIETQGTSAFMFGHGMATNNIFYNQPDDKVMGAWVNGDHNLFLNEEGAFGENPIIGDPLFVDADNGDFHLKSGSPAIDAGIAVEGWEFDFDFNEVPQGDAPDLGVYEFE